MILRHAIASQCFLYYFKLVSYFLFTCIVFFITQCTLSRNIYKLSIPCHLTELCNPIPHYDQDRIIARQHHFVAGALDSRHAHHITSMHREKVRFH
jgi:hypothetical protein